MSRPHALLATIATVAVAVATMWLLQWILG